MGVCTEELQAAQQWNGQGILELMRGVRVWVREWITSEKISDTGFIFFFPPSLVPNSKIYFCKPYNVLLIFNFLFLQIRCKLTFRHLVLVLFYRTSSGSTVTVEIIVQVHWPLIRNACFIGSETQCFISIYFMWLTLIIVPYAELAAPGWSPTWEEERLFLTLIHIYK